MKKILFVLITILLQSILTYCQTNQKELSTKKPEFKKSAQVFEEKDRTWEAALEDLDGDGDLDAVFTSLGSSAQVLFNDGKGFFKDSGQKFASGTHGIAIGDLDNDGDKDLFFAVIGKNRTAAIYLNNGKGIFEISNPGLPTESSEIVRLIDIDTDGDLDAYLWYRNLLYLNNGKGRFSKSSQTLPHVSSFCDLNGDNSVDILSALPGIGFKVCLNDKKGSFTEYDFLQKSDLTFFYAGFGDVDNDGDMDVIFSNGNDSVKYPAGILLNDGTGRFTDSGQKLSAVAYGFVGTGDLNNDGFIDIIITDRENPAKIWMNDGKGKFFDSGIALGEGGDWNNCIIKDIDNDGDMDVFITKVYKGSHGLWFNQLMENKRK